MEKMRNDVAIGGSPAWSPDGKEVAFVAIAGPERLSIHILNVRTGKQKHFLSHPMTSAQRENLLGRPDGDENCVYVASKATAR